MGKTIDNINDEVTWSAFVGKLCQDTLDEKIRWEQKNTFRQDGTSPLYVALVAASKYVGIYRYAFDEDEYGSDVREDVAIEIVDDGGKRLWRLPQVPRRFELIDIIEFRFSGAEDLLKAYMPKS